MQLFYYYISVAYLKMYFRLSWQTWKALFIELVSFFYCIYFLLLLVIWLSVEKMFSTKPIIAFLDLCSCYIFWLHLWVNKNVDGCLKYVYNMIYRYIDRYTPVSNWIESYRIIFWGIGKYRIAGYENRYRIESWRTIRFTPIEATIILFVRKENKITTLCNNYSPPHSVCCGLPPLWRISWRMHLLPIM